MSDQQQYFTPQHDHQWQQWQQQQYQQPQQWQWQPVQYQQPVAVAAVPYRSPNAGAVTAIVLGGIALLLGWIPLIAQFIAGPMSVLATIFGCVAVYKAVNGQASKPLAITGAALGVFTLGWTVIYTIALIATA